jgi:hypothetical protein
MSEKYEEPNNKVFGLLMSVGFVLITIGCLAVRSEEKPPAKPTIVFKGARDGGVLVCAPGYECSCDDTSCTSFTVCETPALLARIKNGYMQSWAGCDNGFVWIRDARGNRVKPEDLKKLIKP